MQLRELIIIISKFNDSDGYEAVVRDASDRGISVKYNLEDIENADDAFLITDSRECADKAVALCVGFGAYLNDISRKSDFYDSLYVIDDIGCVGIEKIIRMYQRCHRIPWHILDTERLSLTEMDITDLDGIYGVYDSPEVSEYAGEPYRDRERALNYIKDYIDIQYKFYEYGIWLVKDKTTGEIIGRAGLTGRAGYEDPEIGYVFAKRVWNKGFATEIISAILDYAGDELFLERVNAFVIPENEVSVHILKKFGFKEVRRVEIHEREHIYMQLEL